MKLFYLGSGLKTYVRKYLSNSTYTILFILIFSLHSFTGEVLAQTSGFDVSEAVYSGNGERLSLDGRGQIRDFSFSTDGTKLFLMGSPNNKKVFEYSLGTAFDVSSATYAGDGQVFNLGVEASNIQSFLFSADGTKMYINNYNGASNDALEYSLATGFDVSTASYSGDSEKLAMAASGGFVKSIQFNNDGTKLFALLQADFEVHEFTLATPYDVSTGTYQGDGEKLTANHGSDELGDFHFNADGTKLILMGLTTHNLYEYNLSTGYDVSTGVYAGDAEKFALGLTAEIIDFSADGKTMVILDSPNLLEYKIVSPVTMTSGIKNSNTSLTITFNQNVVTNGGNPTDFTVVDGKGTNFIVSAQVDGTAGDNQIELTVADLTNAIGDLQLTYSNANNEITAVDGGAAMATDATGISIDADQAAPTMVAAGKPDNNTITIDFNEDIQVNNANPEDFTVKDALNATFQVASTSALGKVVALTMQTSMASSAGDIIITYINNNGEVSDFGNNHLATDAIGLIIDDVVLPTMSSAVKNSNTEITVTFSEPVKTNAGNPTDFTVEDANGNPFVVTAQADGVANDSEIVLTVADLTTAIGDLVIKYTNNNQEIKDFGDNALATNSTGVVINVTGPVFTSGTTASFFENATGTAYTAVATDLSTITYSLGNAKDESQFNIGASNGLITFKSSPDFEAPADLGGDNTYTIDVKASDGTFTTTQEVVITVVDVDDVKPTVVLSTAATSPLSTSFTVNIAFSEDVVNFVLGDITVVKGTILSLTGSGANYSAVISPTASGTLTVDIPVGEVLDAAGNGNVASNTLSVTSDLDKPGVSISSAFTTYVSGAFTATFTFTESVTGFDISDIVATNATLSNFAGSGTTYTATVTPTINGLLQLDVNAGVAQDAAGNTNTVSTSFAITNDDVIPTVSILSNDVSGTTNLNTFKVIVNFSETVTGFDVNDIVVTNGTKSLFAGSLHQYDVFITPTGDGPVTINVAGGVAQDVAGNNNSAAAEFSVISDKTGSTVEITGSRTAITNGAFHATFTFNESVTGFTADDVSVAFASLSNFSGSGSVYTATITPTPVNSSTITIDVAAGVATDAATNANTAATQFSIAYDAVAPTVEITSAASSLISGAFDITATFSEAVTGFVVGDLALTNGAASNFNTTSASVYTATITPAADGLVTVGIGANVAQDAATNGNTAATAFSITNDETKPMVTLTSDINSLTNKAITLTATFSESVTGFVVGDLTLTNATVSNFSGSGTVYTATITPVTDGTFTVGIAAGVAADAAGNTNTAATTFSILADLTAPAKPVVAGISEDTGASGTDGITNDQTLLFNGTAEASSTVEVFIGETSIGTTTANGSGAWTFDHTATTLVAANHNITAKATDAAGNQSAASDALAIKVDLTLAAPIIASISEDTGDSAFDGITTATNLMIFGVAEVGTVVTLKLGAPH